MTLPPQPLPTTTVSGYLGAGKTTLVNRLLAEPHGLAITVLVNDFGAVALDDALIEARDGDVISLANGCMCCQIGGALYDTIDAILALRTQGKRIDHLVIETSGVADPARIAEIAEAEPELEAAHTLVLVDAVNWRHAVGNPRLADTLLRQIEGATLVALAKTDAVDAAALPELVVEIETLAPGVPLVMSGARSPLPFETFLETGLVPRKRQVGALRHEIGGLFASWSWEGEAEADPDALHAFMRRDDLAAWRIKGVVRTANGARLVHRAGEQIELEVAEPPALSRIVAIGSPPRFSPSKVEAAWREVIARREVVARREVIA